MSVTPNPTSPPAQRFRWWRLSVVLLVGVVGFLGYRFYRSTPPIPPDPKPETLEPAVAASVRTARDRVLKEPTSVRAWGDLGEVFFANDLEDEARVCFIEAGRLDRKSPRWPYLGSRAILVRSRRP